MKAYKQCPAGWMFTYMQRAFAQEVNAADRREVVLAKPDGDEVLFEWKLDLAAVQLQVYRASKTRVVFLLPQSESPEDQRTRKQWIAWHSTGHLVSRLSNELPEAARASFQELFTALDARLTQGQRESGMQRCQMAVTTNPDNNTRRRRYTDCNLKLPTGTHRVSDDRYACVLNYAPAIRGVNYLSPGLTPGAGEMHIFMRQEAVDAVRTVQDKVKLTKNNFLGEDDNFIKLLRKNGRSGYTMYLFNVKWGSQQTGGCFPVRQVAGTTYGVEG